MLLFFSPSGNFKRHKATCPATQTQQCSVGVVHYVSLTLCDKGCWVFVFVFLFILYKRTQLLAVPVFLGSKPDFADSRIVLTATTPPLFFLSPVKLLQVNTEYNERVFVFILTINNVLDQTSAAVVTSSLSSVP